MVLKIDFLKEEDYEVCEVFINQCENSVAQQTIAWQKVIKDISSDDFNCFVVKQNNEIVGILPVFIKNGIYGNIMNSIPYMGGYGGIVINERPGKEEIYEKLIREMIDFAEKNGCILATIVTQPFSRDLETYKKIFKPDFILENFVQYVDLQKEFHYKRDIRRQIKKAKEYNIKIIEGASDENIKEFYRVHKKRMTELNAKIFPFSFFKKVKEYMVPENKAKFLLAEYDGRIISGMLLTFHNKVIDYFISNSDTDFAKINANSLLTDHAINWAKKKGFEYWNWQSASSKESGVYKFKARWGGLDGEHYYLTKVLVGDLSTLEKCSIEQIKNEYEWYFVIPYDQLKGNKGG